MSRPETEAGLGGRKSTGDEQEQKAMRGKVGREREDGVATVVTDRGVEAVRAGLGLGWD